MIYLDQYIITDETFVFKLCKDGILFQKAIHTNGDIYDAKNDSIRTGKIIKSTAKLYSFSFPFLKLKATLDKNFPINS